ncbi:hypothetical protein O3P69_012122 [Scylla paramamosain]|uniref:C2H2-type domain-containing protein n=1 Tax=Scylla paramamosain TaxID=85552 RepID=A0AAW0TC77_SCYPA
MAEKWDDGANDSPEVVYDGFSPTTTQPQGLPPPPPPRPQALAPPHPAFVGEGDGSVPLGGSGSASFITDAQQQQEGEMAAPGVADRGQLCFVCCGSVADSNYRSVRSSMNHSHAPLLVLLTEVLGYKLDTGQLHSEVVCKNCYRLLDIIDELHQTLTESKTDVRTKFLETIQRLRLKYPRTDKMLKPRCLRCVQMSQSSARRRGRGRGWKGRVEDTRGRGKGGRGRGRGSARTEDGHDLGSDNDLESVMIMEVEPDIDVDDDTCTGGSGGGQHRPTTTTITTTTATKQPPLPPPQPPRPNIVYDTDPAFFSPDEKLKVGMVREEGNTQVFLCMYCQIRCESALALKMHVRVYHMPVLVYDNGFGTAETRYRMGIKLQNTTCTELATSEKPFACLFCECSYKLQSSLQSHFREHHSPHKPFQCLECKEAFRRPIELSRHRLYRCPVQQKMT